MNLFKENIAEVISEIVKNENFFLIDLIIRGTSSSPVIEVFIDGEKNISAADCAEVSRKINSEIENKLPVNSNYRLDVSSPGIERPLIYLNQYPKHINRMFEVSYIQDDTTKKLTGKLTAVNNSELTFLKKNQQQLIINFNNIKKAKIILSFS